MDYIYLGIWIKNKKMNKRNEGKQDGKEGSRANREDGGWKGERQRQTSQKITELPTGNTLITF